MSTLAMRSGIVRARHVPAMAVISLSHMRLRSRPVPLRRMKLVHGSRSGRLRSKLLEYQSRSLRQSQVRKVQLFTHCSRTVHPKTSPRVTSWLQKETTACKKHSRDSSQRSAPGTLLSALLQGLSRDSCSYSRVRVRADLSAV